MNIISLSSFSLAYIKWFNQIMLLSFILLEFKFPRFNLTCFSQEKKCLSIILRISFFSFSTNFPIPFWRAYCVFLSTLLLFFFFLALFSINIFCWKAWVFILWIFVSLFISVKFLFWKSASFQWLFCLVNKSVVGIHLRNVFIWLQCVLCKIPQQ